MGFKLGSTAGNSPRLKSTDAIVDAIDVGSTNTTGRILIYTGTQPATPETAATGTLLATINLADPAFGDSNASGDAAIASAVSATAVASGTAGYFRVVDRNNVVVLEGDVATSGAVMNFDTVAFVSGGTVTVNTFVVSTP